LPRFLIAIRSDSSGKPCLASDLWALGILVYQLLSGRTPLWLDDDESVCIVLFVLVFADWLILCELGGQRSCLQQNSSVRYENRSLKVP
jgi:serine/threonine protein kinase